MLESKFLYIGLMVFSLLGPLLYSFKKPLYYVGKWKSAMLASLLMMLVFIPWDIGFTRIGVWWFNHTYTLGIDIAGLPLEEWLFFIVIPFACVFVYEVLNHFFPKKSSIRLVNWFYGLYGAILVVAAFIYIDKKYTMVAFGLAGILSLITAILQFEWSARFLRMYLIIWIPFLLVNGILTGVMTESPVVNYNPEEIIGVRILSIPLEDSAYNFAMLWVVTLFYHRFQRRPISGK